jgi:hypothetical protein
LLEARAVLSSIRWLLSNQYPSLFRRNFVVLVDSLVVLYALRKGRSSSPALLRRLRAISALVLATNSVLTPVYVPTDSNPADRASRAF